VNRDTTKNLTAKSKKSKKSKKFCGAFRMGGVHSFAFVSFDDALRKVRELRELTRINAARSGRTAFFRGYPFFPRLSVAGP
jgi:hypothetical protein